VSQQHIDALEAVIAASSRIAELAKALRGDAVLDDDRGKNVASFRDAQRKHPGVSWEAVLGDNRLLVRRSEEALAAIAAHKPRSVSMKVHNHKAVSP